MRTYSPFFQTLHDEPAPVGIFGDGAHYSVLSAVIFHDYLGEPLRFALDHTFAVIWDGDHDERVIKVIEQIYRRGLLPRFTYFGERKGNFTAILIDPKVGLLARADDDPRVVTEPKNKNAELKKQLSVILNLDDDPWPVTIANGIAADNNQIIIDDLDDDPARVTTYLKNIDILWGLGPSQDS